MEKEDGNQGALSMMRKRTSETEFFLQWGTRKRLRCVRIRSTGGGSSPPRLLSHFSSDSSDPSSSSATRIRRKISSRFLSSTNNHDNNQPPCRLTRNQETGAVLRSENRNGGSPEKEDRSYTTRGSVSSLVGGGMMMNMEENGKVHHNSDGHGHGHGDVVGGEEHDANRNKNRGCGLAWPKLYIALSSKEKEEDFLAMKGCKLPQRPKKRTKHLQRTILLVSPGTWLSEMTQERYEVVREKKISKKRPRGLKAMGNNNNNNNVESDSEG